MEKVIRTIENQYGDEIPSAVLYQEDGLLRLWEINCLSSLYNNLGNCHCENHLPSWEEPISTEEVIRRFGKEALNGFDAPGLKQHVFNAFGVELYELETFLRVSYMLNVNPLPSLRRVTEFPVVFSENTEGLTFPEEEPGTLVFVVNSHGEISMIEVEGRQEAANISTEPDLDDVGMPELAIPFDVPELRDLD